MQRLSAEGAGWVPTAGNLATLFAFGLCLALIPQLAQDFDEAIFVLAPILLLLNQARLRRRVWTPTSSKCLLPSVADSSQKQRCPNLPFYNVEMFCQAAWLTLGPASLLMNGSTLALV